MKVAIFKAKNLKGFIKIVENKKNKKQTFVIIGKKVLRLPYNFENTIAFSKIVKII